MLGIDLRCGEEEELGRGEMQMRLLGGVEDLESGSCLTMSSIRGVMMGSY
jgi:hypothetical protein